MSKQEATAYQKALRMSSAAVVSAAVRAMFARRYAVIPGLGNFLGAVSGKISPGSISAALAYRLMKSNEAVH